MSGDANESKLRLDEADVRRIVRLMAEALAPDDGRAAKCTRLMDALAAQVDADGWFWVRSRIPSTGQPQNIDFIYGGGIDEPAMGVWSERSLELNGAPPEHARMYELLAKGTHFTRTRPQLVPDAEWAKPLTRAHVARFGFDEMAYSVVPMSSDEVGVFISMGVMLRRPGKPTFDSRDCAIFHLIFSELGALHAAGLRVEIANDVASLSPRQRTVLAQLLEGRSVPQAAEALCLSQHTVRDHVKAIHRHLGVKRRGELLRRFLRAGSDTA